MFSQNPRKSSLYRTRHKIIIIIRKSHPHIIPNLTFQSSLIPRKSILFSPFYRTKITISPKHRRSHKNHITNFFHIISSFKQRIYNCTKKIKFIHKGEILMTNATTSQTTALQVTNFNFYGDDLVAIRDNTTGEIYILSIIY